MVLNLLCNLKKQLYFFVAVSQFDRYTKIEKIWRKHNNSIKFRFIPTKENLSSMSQRRSTQAVHHNQRDTIGDFISPENGYRGNLKSKGLQVKNHMKDNVKEMRLKQMQMQLKKDEESRPSKPLYKLPQFKKVESRLYNEKENVVSPRRHDSDKHFLTKGQSEMRRDELTLERRAIRTQLEREKQLAIQQAAVDASPDTPRKAAVPRSNEVALLRGPSNSDFITRNKMEAMTMAPPKKGGNAEDFRHEEFGRVPQYLEDRKMQWAEEQEETRRRMPDPNCPPGMCLMSEDERLNTLETLERSREEALAQMRRLPFVIETPSMKKKQDFLESKLRDIDHALGIFSKPKVYVAFER
jgi:hypothetical protein